MPFVTSHSRASPEAGSQQTSRPKSTTEGNPETATWTWLFTQESWNFPVFWAREKSRCIGVLPGECVQATNSEILSDGMNSQVGKNRTKRLEIERLDQASIAPGVQRAFPVFQGFVPGHG